VAVDSPLTYTRSRDLYCVGIILLQMLLGLDVMYQFPNVQSVLNSRKRLSPSHDV
jgi:translation initiation factor 2-alpha kinase 4